MLVTDNNDKGLIPVQCHHTMCKSSKGDITAELMLLKSLEGAAFGAKPKEIAGRVVSELVHDTL